MSTILYYSKFCRNCQTLLQYLSKLDIQSHCNFICIDKRVQENNKVYVILESGDKIILPPTVDKVPALLLLNQGYNVLFGEEIQRYFKPIQKEEVRQATQNNIDPMAFSFNSGFNNVVSDAYSFLDMSSDELSAKGEGGVRQMYNYVTTSNDYSDKISTPEDETNYKAPKIPEGMTVESLQQQRDNDLNQITGQRKPTY